MTSCKEIARWCWLLQGVSAQSFQDSLALHSQKLKWHRILQRKTQCKMIRFEIKLTLNVLPTLINCVCNSFKIGKHPQAQGAGPTNTKVLATNYQGALPRKVNGDTLPCGDTKYRHGSIRIISQPSGQLQRITGVTDGRQSEYYCSHRIGDKFS